MILSNYTFTTIAIVSAFFAAIANILARTLLKGIKAQDFLGINFFTMGAILLLVSPIFYHFEASMLSIGLIALIGLIDTLANYFYFKTFEKTEASVATPILSLSPGFTFLFGWLFLEDVVSARAYLLSFLIIASIIYFSSDKKNFEKFKSATLAPALISSLLFGISAIPAKYLLSVADAINSPTLYMFRSGYIALFSLLFFKFSITDIPFHKYRLIFIRSLFVITQWLLFYYALSLGNSGVTATLGNITPIFVFILSIIFLRERPTLKKAFAASLILGLTLVINMSL